MRKYLFGSAFGTWGRYYKIVLPVFVQHFINLIEPILFTFYTYDEVKINSLQVPK